MTERARQTVSRETQFTPPATLGEAQKLHHNAVRAAAERALERSHAHLEYALRLSGVGFWYCDLPFTDVVWDAHVKEHFFLPHDAHVTIDDFFARMHPDDRAATRAA